MDFVQRNLGGKSLASRGDEGVELNFGSDFGLVGEELNLLQTNDICELDDDLLRVVAVFGALPSSTLRRVVEELCDGVVWVLAWSQKEAYCCSRPRGTSTCTG